MYMSTDDRKSPPPAAAAERDEADTTLAAPSPPNARVREIGGRVGPEPTRFGDWEKNGRCIDF
ncbi:MAG TPA: DUF1674 domain-containing protein [Steroidobacteraceae bacterium]|nr:DUF1674 domain-containing protein [Steroidobacteraceae bacterium]